MTSDRAQAYGRIMEILDEIGPTKLQPFELERIRVAADTLLFADEVGEGVRAVMTDIHALTEHLVDCGRWTDERAQRLVDDLSACGPLLPVS